jgi:hypothetical protein
MAITDLRNCDGEESRPDGTALEGPLCVSLTLYCWTSSTNGWLECYTGGFTQRDSLQFWFLMQRNERGPCIPKLHFSYRNNIVLAFLGRDPIAERREE